jgi:hypothetical protein
MHINILCIGDVVGRPGRSAVSHALPHLIRQHNLHCVICNAENVAGGSGMTPQLYDKLLRYGVSLITMGDHIYRRMEIIQVLEKSDRIVRPANLPAAATGRTAAIYQTQAGPKVAVISLLGRLFMKLPSDCPFRSVDQVLRQLDPEIRIVVVDIHAEATSEKIAMGWHLDGRVSAVVGTHTHVPTADERVLPEGTAYITDLGMTGPYEGVLGRRKEKVLHAMTTSMPTPFEVAAEDPRLCGAIISVNAETGRATYIERVSLDQKSGLLTAAGTGTEP